MSASEVPARNRRTRHNREGRARVKKALIKRDGLVCCYCGGVIDPNAPDNSKGQLSIEHVLPRADGGTNELSNLALAHRGCNSYHGGHRTRPEPEAV